jgi:hypothetical protein
MLGIERRTAAAMRGGEEGCVFGTAQGVEQMAQIDGLGIALEQHGKAQDERIADAGPKHLNCRRNVRAVDLPQKRFVPAERLEHLVLIGSRRNHDAGGM